MSTNQMRRNMIELITAIVDDAITDWILSYAYLLKNPIKKTATNKQYNELRKFKSADNFFKSEWFKFLTDYKITYDWLVNKMMICANYEKPYKAMIYFRNRIKYLLRNELL